MTEAASSFCVEQPFTCYMLRKFVQFATAARVRAVVSAFRAAHDLHSFPTAGEVNLLDDEAVTVGGSNHSHATQDLQDSIAAGDYPEWTLFIQVQHHKMYCLNNPGRFPHLGPHPRLQG